MKTLALAIIAGLALIVAASAGAQVKHSLDGFNAKFDSTVSASTAHR